MRLARWIIIGLVAVLLSAAQPCKGAPPPQAEPPTVEEYWRQVYNALTAVRQAQSSSAAERAAPLKQAADALESITLVRLADGQTMSVDNTALIAALRAENPDLNQVETRLSALIEAQRIWPCPQPDAAAFDKLSLVLARREFQPTPEPPPSPLQEWIEAFNRWLDRLLARLMTAEQTSALGIDWIILIVGGLALAGVAFFFWRNVRAHLVREATLAQDAANSHGLSASHAAKQARLLAATANYREAIRFMYLAALLTLDERGILRYDKALTNREVLRRAAQSGDPALAQAMSSVVETFDRVWYGYAPVDDEAYQSYTQRIQQITNAKP